MHTQDHGEAAYLRDASLDFGRLRALDRIDLEVARGEVLAAGSERRRQVFGHGC